MSELVIKPHPRQVEALKLLSDPKIKYLGYGGAKSGGKILANDGVILTPFGWKKGRDLKVGDLVNNPDGSIQKIVALTPEMSLPLWRVHFSDGTHTDVAEGHLWQAWRAKSRKIKNIPTSGYKSAQVIETQELKSWVDKGYHPQIPVCEPQSFNITNREKNPVDPYLLGLLLGDGCITGSHHNMSISCNNEDMKFYRTVLGDTDISYLHRLISIVGDRNRQLIKKLKDYGLYGTYSYNKFIPDSYKFGSIETRYEIVRGLMDTDGTNPPNKFACSYSTVSEQLAEDMMFILRSLGCVVTLTTDIGKYKKDGIVHECRKVYQLYIKTVDSGKLFKLPRKVKVNNRVKEISKRVTEVEITNEVITGRCITVSNPNGLYITNDFIVTHNSHLARLWLVMRALKYSNSRGVLIRLTFPDLQRSAIDCIKQEYKGVYQDYNEQKKIFTFANGSTIEMAYVQNESDLTNYQGVEYSSICLEEASQHPRKVFDVMKTCLRTSDPSITPKMLLTFNFGGTGHNWLKKLFYDKIFEQNEVPEAYAYLKATVFDNPSVNTDYIKELEALDPVTRALWLEGDPTVITGQFFTGFKPSMHKEPPFSILPHNAKGRLYAGLDLGSTHSTAFQLGYIDDQRVLHVIFSYCMTGYTIAEHARNIYDEIASNRFTGGKFPEIVWADPAGFTQVKLNVTSIRAPIDEFIDLFKSHNVITKFERANNARANGCHIIRSMLSQNKIRYFDGYNKSYEQAMQSAITDPNNVESYKKVNTDEDDLTDCHRYLAVGVSSLVTIGTQTDRPKTHLEKLLKGKLPHQQQKNNDFFAVGTKIGGC